MPKIPTYKSQGTMTSASPNVESNIQLDPTQNIYSCLLYTSPSPRDGLLSRMPSSA